MSIDELVDIVNDNDEVIGQISKHQAHEQGVLHRTVIAEIIDSTGNWTLVKQAADRQDAGQLVSPVGGHVRAGEAIDEALKREAAEEFGLTGEFRYRLIGKKIFNRVVKSRKENHYFIIYEIFTDQAPKLNAEAVAFEKFSLKQLKQAIKHNPQKFGEAFFFVTKNFYPQLIS